MSDGHQGICGCRYSRCIWRFRTWEEQFQSKKNKIYVSRFQILQYKLAAKDINGGQNTLITKNLNDKTYVIDAQVGFEAPQSKHALRVQFVLFCYSFVCFVIWYHLVSCCTSEPFEDLRDIRFRRSITHFHASAKVCNQMKWHTVVG